MKHPFCLSSEEEKISGESSTKFECKNCRHLSLKVFGPLDNVGEIYMESIFRKFSKEQNYKRFNMTAPDFRENEICLQHFQIKADNKFYNVSFDRYQKKVITFS